MKTQYPYRFKTKEELIKEFGYGWKDSAFPGIGWNNEMDHLLGIDFPYLKYELNLNTLTTEDRRYRLPRGRKEMVDRFGHSWTISWDMLTENIFIPDYKPKEKIVRSL